MIPIKKSAEKDYQDLILTLKSIILNLKTTYCITIIGEKPKLPKAVLKHLKNKLNYIEVTQNPRIHQDSITKLILFSKIHKNFIWWHDDMIILKPQTEKEIKTVLSFGNLRISTNKHNRMLHLTRILNNIPHNTETIQTFVITDYCTHTPMLFNSIKLLKVIKMYNLEQNPQLFIETIYNNHYKTANINIKNKSTQYATYKKKNKSINKATHLNSDDATKITDKSYIKEISKLEKAFLKYNKEIKYKGLKNDIRTKTVLSKGFKSNTKTK